MATKNGKKSQNNMENIEISLNIQEPNILQYLHSFEESEYEDKIIDALKVGVIAVQSASPSLDTTVVNEKFHEVETKINKSLKDFDVKLNKQLNEYFSKKQGIVSQTLLQYFNGDNGKLKEIIEKNIGDNSEFGKMFDPDNKKSVYSCIEEKMLDILADKMNTLVKEFSLDEDDSALARLQKVLKNELDGLKTQSDEFQTELKTALDVKGLIKEQEEKTPLKGIVFEDGLADYIEERALEMGDISESVGEIPGLKPRCKKGDVVLTLGSESAAPGEKIVIEIKDSKAYTITKAFNELQEAKENRYATLGIFAVAKGCISEKKLPDFVRNGNDFIVTVDKEELENGKRLQLLDLILKISRFVISVDARRKDESELDIPEVEKLMKLIYDEVNALDKSLTKLETIKKNSDFAQKAIKKLIDNTGDRLNTILEIVGSTMAL